MKISRLTLLFLLVLPTLAGAGIVTTIKPLTLIAAEVTAGIETPQQLLPDGVSAHDYSLKTSQWQALQRAELVVWVGERHERFLASVLKGKANTLAFQSVAGMTVLPQRGLDDNRPLPGTTDTHFWLSPDNAIRLAHAIADARARQNPAQAARYQANTGRFEQALRKDWQAQQARFTPLPNRRYIAYHDAYQYLETSLGLQFAGSLSISPEQKPGVRHLLALKQQIAGDGIRCLLTEPLADAGLIRQVAAPATRIVAVDETFTRATSYANGLQQMTDAVYGCLR